MPWRTGSHLRMPALMAMPAKAFSAGGTKPAPAMLLAMATPSALRQAIQFAVFPSPTFLGVNLGAIAAIIAFLFLYGLLKRAETNAADHDGRQASPDAGGGVPAGGTTGSGLSRGTRGGSISR